MRVMRSAFLSAILCWLATAAPAAPGVPTLVSSAFAASSFVQADGTTLTRNGHPFTIRGAAIYGTSNPHDPADDHTTQVLDWAENAHLTTLRLVNMFVEDGLDDTAPYRATDWVHVDQLLAQIGARGMVATLDLSAFRNHLVRRDIRLHDWEDDCLPSHDRSQVDYAAISPYRAGAAAEWQALIDFVTSRVNTVTGIAYKNDPTIALISLAGEPEPPNTEECGKASTTAELTDFYERTLGMLATDDPNHLHSTGGLFKTDWEHQCDGCGGSGIDGPAIFALADNTLPAIHTYPWKFTDDGTPIDFQAQDLGPVAAGLGKPWFTEEFGWLQSVGDATRASYFTWLYGVQQQYGSVGAMFWNLGPEVAGGSHDVNPNTPLTWSAVLAPQGSWADAGSLTAPRFFATATLLPDQRALVVGGQDGQGSIADVRLYDATANTWSAGAALAVPRSRHTATILDDGRVFVVGGLSRTPNSAPVLASTAFYDPSTNAWSSGPAMALTRYLQTATELGDHRIFVVGGFGGPDLSGQSSFSQATVELYDPVANAWSAGSSMRFYRWGHTATLLSDGKVLVAGGEGTAVVGGCGQNCGQKLASAELFDPATNTWTALPDMHIARAWPTATLLADGRVLISGGQSSYDPAVGTYATAASAELFDPATNTWSVAATMGTARYEHVGGLLPDGRAYVAGGFSSTGGIKTAELYDPATDSWSSAADMNSTRWFPASVVLADNSLLVAGGAGGPSFTYLATSERLTLPATPAIVPSAPLAATAVGGAGEATVSWIAPAASGGSPITGYTVTASPGGASATVTGSTRLATVTGLTGGTAYTFTVTAANAAGAGSPSLPSNSVTPSDPPQPDPFVRAVGTDLELDGQPFTFTGLNIYNANSDDWCANNMDHGLFEQALSDIGLGGVHGGDHGVIRAWFFEPLATGDLAGTRDWTRFDRTIAAAKAAGYYVIPTLGNQWGECGHKGATAPYKTIDWYRTGYTQLQPEDSVYGTYAPYRDWVAEVVARYKDEPAILAWQLLNEAETNPDYPNGCPPGPEAYDALHDWAADMASVVKTIDSNHMLSLGTIGTGQCGTSGPQYKDLHAIAGIDLCEYHDYDPTAPMPGDAFNGLALRIQQCGDLGKPLFIGEVGLRPVDVGGSYDSRVASLRAKLRAQRDAGVVGHLVWNWGPGPRALDSYDIGPGDPVLTLLADAPSFVNPVTAVDDDWIAPSITLNAPNRALYTLNEPVTVSYSCVDSGGSGLATCTGTQPNGATLATSAAGHFTFTVDTTDNVGNHRSISRVFDVTAGDVTTTVPPGPATVTTDPGGVGASASVPIQTTVAFTAPSGPATPVSIDLHAPNIAAPSGYAILGSEVDIDLGGVTRPAGDPIVITFLVDSSTGADPATITVSRTNADGSTDIALGCPAPPTADPDPCYTAAFVAGPGSDVRVTVSTTHASKWLALRRTDRTPPVVSAAVTGTLGSNGWYRSNVGVSWTKTDAQSSILTSSGCGPTSLTADTLGTTLTCSATSAGGTTTKSVTIKRDATAPSLTCQAATFVIGAANAKVSASVSDATSGPASATASATANTSSAGAKTVSVTGSDKAGNATTVSCAYTVVYTLTDFKPAPGTSLKRGSVVTVSFKLRDAANKPIAGSLGSSIAGACDAKLQFSGGDPAPNCFAYIKSTDTFSFDLKTSKTMTPGTYTISVQVFAGTVVVATASVTVTIKM